MKKKHVAMAQMTPDNVIWAFWRGNQAQDTSVMCLKPFFVSKKR